MGKGVDGLLERAEDIARKSKPPAAVSLDYVAVELAILQHDVELLRPVVLEPAKRLDGATACWVGTTSPLGLLALHTRGRPDPCSSRIDTSTAPPDR